MVYKLKCKKLIRTDYSFLITIPKVWLEHHNLHNGGIVKLELADDGSLIIKPAGENHVQATT